MKILPEVKHDRARVYPVRGYTGSTECCGCAPPYRICGSAVVDLRRRRNHRRDAWNASGPGALAVHRHLLVSGDSLQLRVVARGQGKLAGMSSLRLGPPLKFHCAVLEFISEGRPALNAQRFVVPVDRCGDGSSAEACAGLG